MHGSKSSLLSLKTIRWLQGVGPEGEGEGEREQGSMKVSMVSRVCTREAAGQ